MSYQSFPGTAGDSNSSAKLERLRLPADLTGCSVLDVACNEGFFCMEARRRGASRVVGIDRDAQFIDRARERDPETDYRVMDYLALDAIDERFDVILLLSALHYAVDPQRLLNDIVDLLTPTGLFVLECGVAPGRKPEWVTVQRPVGDVVRHPTHSMLMRALRGASVRPVGPSVRQEGDPIDRHVYHARRLRPMVLLVSGPSGTGKSTLLRALSVGGGIIPMNLDYLLVHMTSWCRDKTLLELRNSRAFQSDQLGHLVDYLTEHEAEEAFVDELLQAHRVLAPNADPALTVIEGYALSRGRFREAFTARLKELGCYVWHVDPAAAPDRTGGLPVEAEAEGEPSAINRL